LTDEPARFSQHYEELRAAALAHRPGGHGMALLQDRGMPAWMAVWEALQTPVNEVAATGGGPPPTVTGNDVALVLTDMALALMGR
jgi:hypothetical protein